MTLPIKKFGHQKIEYFKAINLHDVYGDEFVKNKTFDSTLAERICCDLFSRDICETTGSHRFRGDFVDEYKRVYYDQKTAKVAKKLKDGTEGPYFNVKYSNVGSKMFVQMVFKELDLIISDWKKCKDGDFDLQHDARLIAIRYKGEMTFDDMIYIQNRIIDSIQHTIKYNRKIIDPQSFCVKNKITFLDFVNDLASHNVKKHCNLLIFHEPINFEQMKKWDVVKVGNVTEYRTYHKQTNYIITPIDVNKVNVYVDYIGYGGFKVNINTTEVSEEYLNKPLDEIKEHLQELDDAIDVVSAISKYKDIYGILPWNESSNSWIEKKKFYMCLGREVPDECWESKHYKIHEYEKI